MIITKYEDLNNKDLIEVKKRLIREKNDIIHKIADVEFKIKKYDTMLTEKGYTYTLIKRTPLNKSKYTVGIPFNQYQNKLQIKRHLFIISITNPKSVDNNIYYVYDPLLDIGHISGRDHSYQYVNYLIIREDEKIFLRTIEEYLGLNPMDKQNE